MRVKGVAKIVVIAFGVATAFLAAGIGNSTSTPRVASDPAEASPPAATLQQISALDQKPFEQSLRQLQHAVEQASPRPMANWQTLNAITGKLRRTPESAPDYWPAVLRFIQFASSRMALKAPPPGQQPRVLSEILSGGLMRGIREDGKTILLDEGDLGNGEFVNCRVIFTQNPVRLQNASFRGCVFELPVTDKPSPFLQKVSRLLLASNPRSVSIPSL
jgi:hypothetical protein